MQNNYYRKSKIFEYLNILGVTVTVKLDSKTMSKSDRRQTRKWLKMVNATGRFELF